MLNEYLIQIDHGLKTFAVTRLFILSLLADECLFFSPQKNNFKW